MTYSQSLWIYTILLFGIVVVPGMDMLFAVTNALTGGRKAGIAGVQALMSGMTSAPKVAIWSHSSSTEWAGNRTWT